MATKKKVTKRAVKRAVKKVVAKKQEPVNFSDGDVFTATYNKKPISGEIGDYYDDYDSDKRRLYSNDGGVTSCSSNEGNGGWLFYTRVGVDDDKLTFEGSGISNFKIVNDRREKDKIYNKQLPDTIGGHEYTLENGKFIFGCGSIKVGKKEIESLIEYHNSVGKSPAAKLYDSVMREANDSEYDNEADMDSIMDDAKTLLELLK